MGKLYEFFKTLTNYGNASIIMETNNNNEYIECKVKKLKQNDKITIIYNTLLYDQALFNKDNNHVSINENAKLINLSRNYVELKNNTLQELLASVFSANFIPNFSFITSENTKKTLDQKDLESLYKESSKLFNLSNHDISLNLGTYKMITKEQILKVMASDIVSDFSLEDIKLYEDEIILMYQYIKELQQILKSTDSKKEAYYEASNKWIDMYEDRTPLREKILENKEYQRNV